MQTRQYERIHEGMDVLDRDGDKIGKCGETLGQFFNVDAGFLGTTEYYVPFDAITDVQDNSIFLNVDKDDLERMGWDRRPEERGTATTGSTEAETLRLREEELQAHKTTVEKGQVRVGKDVVEEQRTFEVPVAREEVTIERRPVDRRPSDRPIEGTESQTISVPVREEHVEVEKTPVVYEEVGVGKRVTQETQQVSDTIRREELRTDNAGDVEVHKEPRT